MFTQTEKTELDHLVARYERKQAALLPVLNSIQEKEGMITLDSQKWAAQYLGLPLIKVEEVVSFYSLLRTQKTASTHVMVCRNLPCALKGSEKVLEGLKAKASSSDISCEAVECLGACDNAPVVIVNKAYVGEAGPDRLDEVLTASADRLPLKVFGPKDPAKRILTTHWADKDCHTLSFYLKHGGYEALKKALKMEPAKVTDEVKAANLRGLGGAGFPCGMKWGFIPKTGKPVYLVVNADEGEPGTFKDRLLMEKNPHELIEGIAIACHAIGSRKAYVYIRKEYETPFRRLSEAVEEAVKEKLVDVDIVLHRGAGAYICGEETGLLESLEGKKGWPRIKPPFPAVVGLFGCPTAVNNVETLAHLPHIINRGAKWFAEIGSPKNGGTRLFSISGSVNRPGVYELPMGTSLREMIFDYAQGIAGGRALKAVIPGGLSSSILTKDEIDVAMDFDSLAKAGTMAGSGGVIVLDETVDIVRALYITSRFYAHESCGQCSPCREGTGWMKNILERVVNGQGRPVDPDNLISIASHIGGFTICPLGDAASLPVLSYVRKFRSEFDAYVGRGTWDVGREAKMHA